MHLHALLKLLCVWLTVQLVITYYFLHTDNILHDSYHWNKLLFSNCDVAREVILKWVIKGK